MSMQICLIHKWNVGFQADEITYKSIGPTALLSTTNIWVGLTSHAHVSVYRIDVRGKRWYWSYYTNSIDVVKSVAFKVFKLVNPDDKMDFLAFTRRITTHYLKASKLKKQLPPNILYLRKRSRKGNAVVPANERK